MIYIRWNNINVVNYAGETETQQTVSTGFRSSVAERATVNREVEGSMPSGTVELSTFFYQVRSTFFSSSFLTNPKKSFFLS